MFVFLMLLGAKMRECSKGLQDIPYIIKVRKLL